MNAVLDHPLAPREAGLWWLGQAGYLLRTRAVTVVIDPYLTDSAAGSDGAFARVFPPPLEPEALRADVFIITHDHGDHLDPLTLARYPAKETTRFLAPRHTARRLRELGLPAAQVTVVNEGETWASDALSVRGIFALPTGAEVLDTTGYLLEFANGRSVYHTSDTTFHPLVLQSAPSGAEVLLVPINGKWGNPSPAQAVELAAAVRPRFVFPNHYDLMALNAENPETFRWLWSQRRAEGQCVIPPRMEPFVWS